MQTTVARLRPVLARYFPAASVNTVLAQARKAGGIPHGAPGYGGAGSAAVDTSQVAPIILTLACRAARLPGETQIGQMRLTRSEPLRFDGKPSIAMRNDFLAGLVEDIERCAEGAAPGSWVLTFLLPGDRDWLDPTRVRSSASCRLR
jgi:hypothetical protein